MVTGVRSQHFFTLALLCCAMALTGCQTNPSGGTAWPWQQTPAAPQVAAAPPNPNNGPWAPVTPSSSVAGLEDIFRRENEQNRFASEQRQALADLVEWQRRQEQQLAQLARAKRDEAIHDQNAEIQKLRDEAEQLAAQKREIGQLTDLRRQALELDSNNQQLHSQLAQSQQQNRVLEDQVRLMQQQLRDTAQQLSQSVEARQQVEQQAAATQQEAQEQMAALNASMSRRNAATITANNSVQNNLTAITIAGLNIRQDGDVVRIELPSDRIFGIGTATLTGEALTMIDQVAGAIRQNYPNQIIGVEAHTDSGALQTSAWRSKHQLSAAQAMAVFDQLIERHQFPAQQLFVLGHGPNYPIASNATPAGQQRNRRVEVVVYPETFGRQ